MLGPKRAQTGALCNRPPTGTMYRHVWIAAWGCRQGCADGCIFGDEAAAWRHKTTVPAHDLSQAHTGRTVAMQKAVLPPESASQTCPQHLSPPCKVVDRVKDGTILQRRVRDRHAALQGTEAQLRALRLSATGGDPAATCSLDPAPLPQQAHTGWVAIEQRRLG